jgi:hypothetical protein
VEWETKTDCLMINGIDLAGRLLSFNRLFQL